MSRFVVDTNVAIVANGDDEEIALHCRFAAIELLMTVLRKGVIYLDSAGEIQDEYRRYLNPKGQPGVGDRFYLEILNSHPRKVARVDVRRGQNGEYDDLPQAIIDAGFDPSDRKFAVVALRANAPVYNAVDTDCLEKKTTLEENGVNIVFLCGCDPAGWRNDGASEC